MGRPTGENGDNFMKKKIPDPKSMRRIRGPKLSKAEGKMAIKKVRITTYVNAEALAMLKELAKESGNKYQVLLNDILEDYLGLSYDKGSSLSILSRIKKLEKKVFG